MEQYILECCVDSVESALEAAEGGADRLELCSNLIIGGTSPSPALFEQIRKYSKIPIRVLLRPRFGDFLYTAHEFQIIKRETEFFKDARAEGIVIGCLTRDGDLDMEQMRELVEAADGMKVTLHRAFDLCRDPVRSAGRRKSLGSTRFSHRDKEAAVWKESGCCGSFANCKSGKRDRGLWQAPE